MGSIGQNSTFPEHGHVAYQFKGNHEYSTCIVANMLPADYPPPHLNPGDLTIKGRYYDDIMLLCHGNWGDIDHNCYQI